MSEQRRQYFRVEDEAIVYIEKIDQDKLADHKKDIFEQNYNHDDAFNQFFKFESDLQSILSNNKTLSADWVNIVEILNAKINQLAKLTALNHQTIFNHSAQPINLSANGLGMDYPIALPEGELVKIVLILLPQYIYLGVLGRVMHCKKKDQEKSVYALGIKLEVIRSQDTDRLIQHIMKKEAEWLKYRREQSVYQDKPPSRK